MRIFPREDAMDRRRFAKRTATLIAAAAIPGLARAQKSAEDRSNADKADPKAKAEEQKAKAAEEKHQKSPEGKAEEKKVKNEEASVKSGKKPQESVEKAKARLEERKAKAPQEKKAKDMPPGPAEQAAKNEEAGVKNKAASLDDARWQREQEARRLAALRRVKHLIG